VQRTGIFVDGDLHRLAHDYGTGVQPGVHSHDGDSGFAITREQRSLDGRGSAPARQQRRMNIEGARRGLQHAWRKNQTVGRHHHCIRLRRAKARRNVGAAELSWLPHVEASGHRKTLDRARVKTHTAPCGAVGLREDQDHLVTGRHHGGERTFGEVRRTGEN
jgi:hypothetical protein